MTTLDNRPNTALLVVDVQNDFCHEDGVCATVGEYPVERTKPVVARVTELLEAARGAGLHILHPRLRVDWDTEDELWLGRLLRHQQPRFFPDAQILAIAIRRVQRFVNQAHVPVAAVGHIDHVPPLPLQMREPHQEVQLCR